MPLINLKLIGRLSLQACTTYRAFEATCFNNWPIVPVDPGDAYLSLKTYKQAKNLFDSLKSVHRICTDLTKGKLPPLKNAWSTYFATIENALLSGGVNALPTQIEQYAEFVLLASQFAALEKEKKDLFGQGFSPLRPYAGSGEESAALIPATLLSEQIQLELEVNAQISDIDVEYCLDGYNKFYQTALQSIAAHKTTGTIQACASEILSLFN